MIEEYQNLILIHACQVGRTVQAASKVSSQILIVFKEMADKEDGSFILSPEKLAGFKPGKGGEILLLT